MFKKRYKDMSSTLTVILLALFFVAFFVVAMSLTLIFKGHNIDSEISTNKHMQERGITCAIQEHASTDSASCDKLCGDNTCFTCEKNESSSRVANGAKPE